MPKKVLAALAFLIILLVLWNLDLQRQKAVQEKDKLLTIGIKNISAITFAGREKNRIEILKKNGSWRMVKPIETEADKWQVRSVIRALDNAYLTGDFSDNDLSRFGIGENGSIIISGKNDKSIKIQIGKKSPDHSSLYVSTDNKSVRMVPAAIEKKIQVSLFELRAKNFVATDLADIRQIKVESDKGDYRLEKDKKMEKWRITSPVDESADKYKASRLFADIAHLSASGFVPADKSKFDPPALEITITDKTGKTEKVVFGMQTEGGNRFVKSDIDGGRTGRIPSALFESIPLEYENLLDKKIIDIDQSKIKKISIDNGAEKYEITSTKEAGKSEAATMMKAFVRYGFADSKDKADQSSIGRYLINLGDYEYLEKEKPDKREANKKLVLHFDDETKAVVEGSKTGSACHLVMNEKRYMRIDCALLPKIFPAKKEMTDRSLFRFKNNDLEKIEIKMAGRKISFVREGESGLMIENGNRVRLDRLKWNRFLWFLHSMTYDQTVTGKIGTDKKEIAIIFVYNTGLELIEKFTFYESGTENFVIGKNRYFLPDDFAIKGLTDIINGLHFKHEN